MRSLEGQRTAWKVDVRRAVRASHKKLQSYYSEVTPESGLLLILAALLDSFRKTKTFRAWDANMNIDPKDSESYTAQYTEAFMDYWEEMYVVPQCAPQARKEDSDSGETKTDAMYDSSSTSRSASPDVAYFSKSSDDFTHEPDTPACPPITPARALQQDRLMEVASKYINSVNADPAALGQHPPKTDDLKSDNLLELTAAFWKTDVAAYWRMQEDSCTEYAPLARMARDIFSVIPHGVGVEASLSLGRDVVGWRQCRTSGDTLQKKVIVRQFARSNPGIVAGAGASLENDAAAGQNEQKEEDKKLLQLAGIAGHIHFRRVRKERKKAKQQWTNKESEFTYISDTEEISGSGWGAFKDCGTEVFHEENGPPPTKKSGDTIKVVRTYKPKRILRVDRQPGSIDDEDEANASDTDDDADCLISSNEEAEDEKLDRQADNEVPIAVPHPSATVMIRNFNPPIRRSARLAEPERVGGRSVHPAERLGKLGGRERNLAGKEGGRQLQYIYAGR